ncbi:hypothetical protein RN001_004237 [Aquatica leii]|uniref:Uncharacterized protein n=1 Tax=Aquatica leii TaxID=1421715 RepID=A0AAN7SPG7_9COLE|nr:hypothetical protein RN001_004237 [Aquatica leii]
MPLSRGEKLRRKRESEKRRYDTLKKDPESRAKLKQKEREQYIKKKEKKIVRPINEQNEREQRMKRKHWRKHSRTYRLKKKLSENTSKYVEENTPPSSPAPAEEVENIQREETPQSIAGKRLAARNRKRRNRQLQEKGKMIQKLQKKLNKYKVKCHRLQNEKKAKAIKLSSNSPGARVKQILKEKNENPEVVRKVLFAEVMKDQLKDNYQQLRKDKDKSRIRQILHGKMVKKYRFTNEIRNIVRGSLTYNSKPSLTSDDDSSDEDVPLIKVVSKTTTSGQKLRISDVYSDEEDASTSNRCDQYELRQISNVALIC